MSLLPANRMTGIPLDDISVSPANNTADPLERYLAYTPGAFSYSNYHSTLSSTPATRTANLNEWVRFDAPGTYVVSATSRRVYPNDGKSFFGQNGFKLLSNTLQLHIIPATPAWQKDTLTRALRELAKPAPENGDPQESRTAAIEDLRYLATSEAIAALAANLSDDHSDLKGDAFEGLVGLPRSLRDAALAAMTRLIEDPHFPVCSDFFDAMAFVQLDDLPLPDFDHFHFGDEESEAKIKALTTAFKARRQVFFDAAWQATALALPHKVEPARGTTAHTLADTQPAEPPPTALAQLGAVLRATFPSRSNAEKVKLLQDQWDVMSSREMLPQLRALAVLSDDDSGLKTDNFEASPRNLRGIALRRWFEFEPEAATREVINQIGSATPTLDDKDLDFLPPQTLPQFEPVWAKAFSEGDYLSPSGSGDMANLTALLIHFGTGSAAIRMLQQVTSQRLYEGGNRSYDALTYLVRFDPQAARPFLAQIHEESDSCLGFTLYQIAEKVQDPILTESALKQLGSTCVPAVDDALRYLSRYGDGASARQPILDAFLTWSKGWTDKQALEDEEQAQTRLRDDANLGQIFVSALLSNQGWLADSDLIATVEQHCVTKTVCEMARQLTKPDLSIRVTDSPLWRNYGIDSYSAPTLKLFEVKLDQYPQGTVFHLEHSDSGYPGSQRRIEAQMADLLEKHGMKLATPTP